MYYYMLPCAGTPVHCFCLRTFLYLLLIITTYSNNNNNNKRPLTPKSMPPASRTTYSNNNNKRPLTPKSMPPAGDEHAKLKT